MAKRAFHDIAETPVPAALEHARIELALFPESGDVDGVVVDGWMTTRFMGRTPQLFTTDARFVDAGRTLACVTHLCHGWRRADAEWASEAQSKVPEPAHG